MHLAKTLLLGADELALRAPPRPLQDAIHTAFGKTLPHMTDPAVARAAELGDRVGLQPVAHPNQGGDGYVAPDRIAPPERRDRQATAQQHHVQPHLLSLEDRPGNVDQLPVLGGSHAP